MSGTYPTSPGFTNVDFKEKHFQQRTESLSGSIKIHKLAGSRFEFTVTYPPMTRAEFRPVLGFLAGQRGMESTFTIVLPNISYKTSNVTGSPLVNGNSFSGSTVTIDQNTGTFKAGDLIKFNSHSKVYTVTQDLTGAGVLKFYPPLRETVINNDSIIYDAVPFTVRLANPVQEYTVNSSNLISYEVDLIEV